MTPVPPTSARVAELLASLSTQEKASLTSGADMFSMKGSERLGIPKWAMTDGPNGARGSSILGSGEARSVCIPCGSALGASWNETLIEQLGQLLGDETRTKQARVLLAPTVNLHRSPLAGRNFECFSEDPLLSGKAAAAYIRGVQARGVMATVKHFVANEAETDRNTVSSEVDQRTLRELYLVPFEYAVKEGHVGAIMTSYNRVNGTFCPDSVELLDEILRQQWGFDGIVMTDWFGVLDTVAAANAGLDLEMPGGDRNYGARLGEAVAAGKVDEARVHVMIERQLRTFERIGALDDETGPEQSIDRPEHRALSRIAAADTMVLLRNERPDGSPVLPFNMAAIKTLAVIGPNAATAQIMGGGSANLRPHHRTSPLAALQSALSSQAMNGTSSPVTIVYEQGCSIDKAAPLISGIEISANGRHEFHVDIYASTDLSGPIAGTTTRDTSRLLFMDNIAPGVTALKFSARALTTYTPNEGGVHEFEIIQALKSKVYLDGELILDGATNRPPRGKAFFGMGSEPMRVQRDLERGRSYEVMVEIFGDAPNGIAGMDLGVKRMLPADAMERAVAAARNADAVVLVVGTNDGWETEGEDRVTMDLPGDQDQLIRAITAANPNTVVVVNTGAPVTMDWAPTSPAVLQVWFGGQEMGPALVDVLTGLAEPGGRLPTTIPLRIEHNPSYGNFPGANGKTVYGEGVFVGYRWYESRALGVRFPFGHGLSYTTFEMGAPVLSKSRFGGGVGQSISVSVPVTNTGARRGSHVVQCYVTPPDTTELRSGGPNGLERPSKELRAFAKVSLDPGQTEMVTLVLTDRSFAYWDPARPEWPELRKQIGVSNPMAGGHHRIEPGWRIDPGSYRVLIGSSVADIAHDVPLEVSAE
jgi:beta-glucosidase